MNLTEFTNKIICGNCIDVMKNIPNESISLVVTDPPYNISSKVKVLMKSHPRCHRSKDRYLTYDFGEWDWFESEKSFLDFTESWMKECYRVLKPSGNFVSFFGGWLITDIKRIWEKQGGKARQKLYFIKTNPKPRLRKVDFMHGVEEVFWGAKSEAGHVFNYEYGQHLNYILSSTFYFSEITGHPNQKPERTVDWIIKYLSEENGIVLDPFCGSGTVLKVSKETGRNYIGIDLNQKYCRDSELRIEKVVVRKNLFGTKGMM